MLNFGKIWNKKTETKLSPLQIHILCMVISLVPVFCNITFSFNL